MRRARFHKTTLSTALIALVEYPNPAGATGIRVRHPDGKVELVNFVPRPRYGMRPVIAVIGKGTRDALYGIGMKPYAGPVFDFIPESLTCDMRTAIEACWDEVSDETRKIIVNFVRKEVGFGEPDPVVLSDAVATVTALAADAVPDAPTIAELRKAYRERFGKNPSPAWKAETLQAKLDAEG